MEARTLAPLNDIRENRSYYLPLLIIISIVSHFPFVLKGFGEIDATKIAVSVIDMLNNGPDAAFANFYFSDVIPLYIVYLKWSMKLLDHNYSYLPLVMNYTSAVFGTLTVIPAYFLIRKLFGNPSVAFYTVLALIFAPSFYQATIMGFPHLIAFFFILVSFCFYLYGLERERPAYLPMFLSCLFLTLAFLFKSDILLVSGAFIGFLLMKKVADRGKIASSFLIILISGVLFLIFRNLIIGTGGEGTTMSKDALSHWYNYSLIIPGEINYFIRQAKPIAYGAGIVTFFLGIISLVYFLLKRRLDILSFLISWAAVPILFWMVMIGNNARHNMTTTLPILAVIVLFFHEKAPRFLGVLIAALILGNFALTAPSFSILTPSGNLFKSNALIEKRMEVFHARAKDIADLDEDKIAVLGFFHNPHVVFEIMRSTPAYEAAKIGREDYRILTGTKEYVFIYFVVVKPEDMYDGTDYILKEYGLHDHVFTSATYDLKPLEERGLKTKGFEIIKRSTL
jgi:hypothetical protein